MYMTNIKIREKLSINLLELYDFEKGRHNRVVRVLEGALRSCPFVTVFEKPLQYHKDNSLPDGVEYWEDKDADYEKRAGYHCLKSNHKLEGPVIPDLRGIKKRLSTNLVDIFNYEITNGNEVKRIDKNVGSKCSLDVVFYHPLKFREKYLFDKTKSLPEFVEYCEDKDPHYSIAAGFRCTKTGHAISGPC